MATVHHLPIVQADPGMPARAAAPGDDEPLLQIGDLAREVGKTVRAIHHYESIGLLQPHKRSKGRFRLYSRDAVARVRWIVKLGELGMSLSEIQQIFALWEKSPTAPEAMRQVRAVYHQKLKEVHEQIARLSALERELGASLEYLDTCNTCDPHELIGACCDCTVHHDDQPEPELVAGIYATTTPKS
jgi:MerR family transcriptional regulator, copper efflux regulator